MSNLPSIAKKNNPSFKNFMGDMDKFYAYQANFEKIISKFVSLETHTKTFFNYEYY